MAQEPISLGGNFYLNPLNENTNCLAYQHNFISIKNAEPSLGIPTLNTYAEFDKTYYFPLITEATTYVESRKFSNSDNSFVYKNNKIGIGTNNPNERLTIIGGMSATNKIVVGQNNSSASSYSSILGGENNNVFESYSTIGGGTNNTILSSYGYIGGGFLNQVNNASGIIAGGTQNIINGNSSNINGGGNNIIDSSSSNINGGNYNTICEIANSSIIGGGNNNTINSPCSIINGGYWNTVLGNYSTIGGGYCNVAESCFSSVNGGYCNTISGYGNGNFILGGGCNFIDGSSSTIAGGYENTSSGYYNFIGSGVNNKTTSSSIYSSILNGCNNELKGNYSSILGGNNNQLSGNNSFILGSNFSVNNIDNTTFVENLSTTGKVTIEDQLIVKKDVLIYGGLSALSGITTINTEAITTSSLYIENYGVGPALYVYQDLNYPIGEFVSNQFTRVLYIGNTPVNPLDGTNGFVGINTNTPNKELTVNGSISANDKIYTLDGNSDQWNYTATKKVTSIGNNLSSTFIFYHNLSSRDIITQVYDNTTYNVVYPIITNTTEDYITISFDFVPESDRYRVIVRP